MALFNLARMTVSSSGTGTITLNAAVSGFLTFDAAGCSTAAAGQAVTYAIGDTTQSEIASGTYFSSSITLTRGSSTSGLKSTNSNSPINMSNAAQVIITPQAMGIIGRVNIQTFTASGTYTPTTGMIVAAMECVGGGGGGGGASNDRATNIIGNAAGGGGGGGYSMTVSVSSAIGTSQAVTIGAGGAGGAAGLNNGSSGQTTSIGSLCIAIGGSGGIAGNGDAKPLGGAGGVKGTGTVTMPGQPGGIGWFSAPNFGLDVASGAGGCSALGGGANSIFSNSSAAVVANAADANTGGGGGGATCGVSSAGVSAATAAGGNGGSGIAIITEYCSL